MNTSVLRQHAQEIFQAGPTHTHVMDLHILLIGGMGLTE